MKLNLLYKLTFSDVTTGIIKPFKATPKYLPAIKYCLKPFQLVLKSFQLVLKSETLTVRAVIDVYVRK